MFNKIKDLLSPLVVKIFLGFWVITIVSIVTTRWISMQLANDFVAHPASKLDIKQVNRITNKLIKQVEDISPNNVETFAHYLFEQRQFRRIYLKNVNTGQLYSARPIKQIKLKSYLSNETFDNPVSIHTRGYYLVGPKRMLVNNTPIDVFWSHRGPSRHQPGFFSQLPPWARIGIPLIISLVLCWLLSWSITRPIRAITDTTKALGKGDLSARVDTKSMANSEVGNLANSMNQMASQLESLVTGQQRLLADISHELRSPLTRLQLALALANKVDAKPEEMDKYLDRFELEIGRLDEMIGDVLQLSRLENSIHSTHLQTINLTQLLIQLKDDADIIATKESILLNLKNVNSEVEISADPQLISSAVENIVTNAIKYAPEGSQVNIILNSTNEQVEIIIQDQGKGVPEKDITQIFEPFYRVNEARDRNTGGTGLGLAIAKRAILVHKGNIMAKNTETGFEVKIELPITKVGNQTQNN